MRGEQGHLSCPSSLKMDENCRLLKSGSILQAKEMLEAAGLDPTTSVLGGATIAGFFAASFSLPFDFVKTRMQEMQRKPDGTFPYR